MLLFSKSSSPHKNPNTNKQQTSKWLTPSLSWLPSSLNFISVWHRVLAHSHPTQPGRSCRPREILGCTWLQMQLPWCCYGRCQTAVAWVHHTSDALAAYTLKRGGGMQEKMDLTCVAKALTKMHQNLRVCKVFSLYRRPGNKEILMLWGKNRDGRIMVVWWLWLSGGELAARTRSPSQWLAAFRFLLHFTW